MIEAGNIITLAEENLKVNIELQVRFRCWEYYFWEESLTNGGPSLGDSDKISLRGAVVGNGKNDDYLLAEQSFNEEEEEKLQGAFLLDKQSLKLVLETISFILEQAVYHNLKTPVFRQQLENIQLEQSKIEAFASVWDNAGPETVEKFRQRTFTPKKVILALKDDVSVANQNHERQL
ncbi:unnamed protein product [Ranitomeya imitator]|uniref:Uncharacterized protein n=1 Tax=Ranitomeya imitator TaxID=111125 RepID=A0ABN9L4Y1_9NEOB|nr:unnamed protein product [Ranitomeya imitator]